MSDERPIGVFDSGVGGVSVLASLLRELPHEHFIYFGDAAHAPYGDRSQPEVLGFAQTVVNNMIADDVKAIVIACNTATSAAAATLREEFADLPIVGVEPALKPAVLAHPQGTVLVMASALTLRLEKYKRLVETWGSAAEVHEVACVGLMECVEREEFDAPELRALLEKLVGSYAGKTDAVVLGCTHYPFVATQISEALGGPEIFDGAAGTARRLRARLTEEGILAGEDVEGSVVFRSSSTDPAEPERYERFLRRALADD